MQIKGQRLKVTSPVILRSNISISFVNFRNSYYDFNLFFKIIKYYEKISDPSPEEIINDATGNGYRRFTAPYKRNSLNVNTIIKYLPLLAKYVLH